jgi:putative tricarboxylic transport membrane protein
MRLGRDGIAGLIGLAVSLGLIPFAIGLPKLPIVPVGPGFYPIIVLVFMAATSAALLVQDIVAQRRAAPAVMEAPTGPPRAYDLVLGAFAVVGAYTWLMPYLGYRIATALFVAAFQIVLERPTTARQWLILVTIAVGTSWITYLLFDQYLAVLLPRGRWVNW